MENNMRIRSIWCAVFFLAVPLYEALGDDPTCGDPPTIDLASLTSIAASENAVGTTVTYACQFGYVIEGTSRTSTCELTWNRKQAKWSDPRVTCIPRSCGDPGFVTNGHRLGSLFTFPNSVSYECEEGFRLQGNGRRFCQASGSWSGRLPRCEAVSCDPPNNPENGRVTYGSLEFGAELHFECNPGYALQDKTPVHCRSNGTWSKTDVACIEKKCDVLQTPEHGTMEYIGSATSPKAGTIAVFTCEEDRIASGPTSSKCLSTGEWTFPAPLCLEPCSIPFVQNGNIGKWVSQSRRRGQVFQEIPVGQRIEDDEKLFLHCVNGYRPMGDTTNWQALVACKGGKWSAVPFCEQATCKAEPPEVENGRVEKMDPKHGGTVLYECLPNFSKVKTGNVNCNMGEWKGMPPTCKDVKCHEKSVKDKTGVAEISEVTQHEHVLHVRCKEGYEPKPNLQQCWNGEWKNNQESPCKQRECTVPWIRNGHIEEQILGPSKYNWWKARWEREVIYRRVEVGTVTSREAKLFLVCQAPYSIQGTGTYTDGIKCSEGRWSPDLVCSRTGSPHTKFTEAPGSVNINRFTQMSPTTARTTTTSEASRFDNGAVGSKSTTATRTPVASDVPAEEHHEESYVPPDSEELEDECFCEYLPESDGNFVAHADGKKVKINDKVKNGTVLKLRCEKVGYHRLFGPTEVLCGNCRPWSTSDFPSCVDPQRGDTIIVYYTVNVSLDGVLEPRKGQSVRLSCAAMETEGYPEWRVPNVIGIEETKEPLDRGKDVLYLSHLFIMNITSKYNGYYSCGFGKNSPTTVQIQVVDPEARCRRFSIDEKELDVEYDGTDTRVGRRATFSCQRNGQNLNGTTVATCLKTEKWSSPPPKCTDIMCRELKESDLMTIDYTDNRKIGSFANFHCFAPGTRSGVARTQCLENGEWKDSSPKCSTPPCLTASLSQVIPHNVEYDNDNVTDSSMPYNSTVKLSCRGDKNLVGNPFATCNIEGTWEVGNITCIKGCPPFIKMPELLITPEKDIYKIGELVTLSCIPGHDLSNDLEIVMCLQSGWSAGALPECIKSDEGDEGKSKTRDN